MILLLFTDYPFMPNVKISADPGPTLNQGESSFAVSSSGDSIFVACNTNERGSYAALPFAASYDGGTTFPTNYNFVDNSVGITWHTDPVVGIDDSGYVHLLVQFSIYVIRHYLSRDGGHTWTDTSNISDLSTGGDVDKPWMVVKGDTVYVAWQEFGGSEEGIRFARSYDRGRTWQRFTVDPTTTGLVSLAVSPGGILHLAIIEWTSGNITYRRSYDHGSSWTSPVRIDYVSYNSGYGDRAPINSIAVFGDDTVFVTWVDDRNGTWDVLGAYSYDGGNTWSPTFVVNQNLSGGQCKGWATFDPYGGLHVFYYDTPSWPTDTFSVWSVKYRYSPDFGQTWNPEIRITDTTFTSPVGFMGDYHTIYADSNYVYAVWADGREGDLDLFFSKAPIPLVKVRETYEVISEGTPSGYVKVYDVSGRLIYEGEYGKMSLKSGVYFVKDRGKVFKVVF